MKNFDKGLLITLFTVIIKAQVYDESFYPTGSLVSTGQSIAIEASSSFS